MEEHIEEEIDLRDYLRVIIKRRWIIIAFFAIVVLTVAVHTFTANPIFKATSRIVIEKENPKLVSIQEVMAVDATGSDYYQTQYKIIESRTVAREVIKRLNLENSLEFFPVPKDDIVSSIKGWFGDTMGFWKEWIKSLLHTGIKNAALTQEIDDLSSDSDLVSAFISRIDIQPIRNSRLVDVSIEAMSPVMAARMANELVRAYINQNLEIKLAATKDAVQWLSDRIDDERKKVETAENALLRYKEQHGIITDFSSDAEKITAQKLAQLNTQVVEVESRRVEAETRYKQAIAMESTPDMLDSIPEVLNSELIREIKKMEVVLYNRMSELSKKYGRKHPKMVAIESELSDLQKRKIKEVKRVVNSLGNEYKLAVAREESLKKALERQKNESLEMNKKAVQYGVLRRQAESSRNMYELLVKRFKETSLTEEMKTGNIRIIDKAEIPRSPVKPKKKLNLLLAMVVGLTMGVGLAFFLEYLDNTVKLPDEIKEHFNIPCLGIIPVFPANEDNDGIPADLVTVHSPKSIASESFRGVRTGILFSFIESMPQVVLVTSASPREGKTVCTANLAITIAQAGSNV
ncbi:MAG: exopolysaccharide transport family protein, partial [Desulfobacterales bacterium]